MTIWLEQSFSEPAMNLACDEVLLELCEEGLNQPILRVWESPVYFVVLGFSKTLQQEVQEEYCQINNIPILRRCSGGGTVLQGPGCLNYSLIMPIKADGPYSSIHTTNQTILDRMKSILTHLLHQPVDIKGDTDLVIGNMKFSGNSQKRKNHSLLFHGTILLDFDISLINKVLKEPARQPEYRNNRLHPDFLINLNVSPDSIKSSLQNGWDAHDSLPESHLSRIRDLALSKYQNEAWNRRY